ncbi:MAG: amino acid racemase [Synergistaceae bacterium]
MAKILGILGGMGPAASAEFMKIMAEKYPATKDQEHPKVYLLSDPTIPDRSTAVTSGGVSPEPQIKADLEQLIDWGAEVLAVPCNSAHCFINNFRNQIKVPYVHIIEATVKKAKEKAPRGAWMVATQGTIKAGLYQQEAEKENYRLIVPPQDICDEIQSIIKYVKSGDMKTAGEKMKNAVEKLWKIEKLPVATACTELPLAYNASSLSQEYNISSLDALVEECINEIDKENK